MEINKDNVLSIQRALNERAHFYLRMIKDKFGNYLTSYEQKELLNHMELTNFVSVETEFQVSYTEEKDKILNDPSLTEEEKKVKIDEITKEVY